MQSSSAGPALSPVAAFFKEGFRVCISIFDSRRGDREGEEYDKVLSFYPTTAAVPVRCSIVGLAQAMTSFASTFSEVDRGFRVMDAEHNKWVMYEAEPSIWFVVVVRKAWAGSSVADEALKAYLQTLHSVFVLLHGRISALLEQDPTAHSVRRTAQPLTEEAGIRLEQPRGKDHGELANPLAPHSPLDVPLVPVSHHAFLAVQCLVNHLLVSSFYGSRLVSSVVVLWQGMPLWSTLQQGETAALHAFANKALLPAAKAARKPRGMLRTAAGAAASSSSSSSDVVTETLLCPHQWRLGAPDSSTPSPSPTPTSGSFNRYDPSPPSSSSAAPSPHQTRGGGGAQGASPPYLAHYMTPKMRTTPRSQLDLFAEPAIPMARVWLQTMQEWALLLPYSRGPLTLLLLLHHDSQPPSGEVLEALAAVLARGVGPVLQRLGAELPQYNLWHHPGFRYCYVDSTCAVSRFTPPRKVSTLTPGCQRMLAELRNKTQLWQASRDTPSSSGAASASAQAGVHASSASGAAGASNSVEGGDESEVVVRSATDCWMVMRRAGGRVLTVAMEQPPEHTFPAIVVRVSGLAEVVCPGVFLGM